MSNDIEIRNLLREATRILVHCSEHQYPHTKIVFRGGGIDDDDENTETTWEFTESALMAQKAVKKIYKYLEDHPNAEEEAIKRKRESDHYNI